MMRKVTYLMAVATLLLNPQFSLIATADESAPEFIAGVDPSRRPDGAPIVQAPVRDHDWYRKALTGVVPPYPISLSFLENQGNWFSPFNHPGMPGRYNIRNW